MPTSYQIRPARRDDMPAIAALMNELSRAEGYAVTTDTAALTGALFGDARDVALQALVAHTGDIIVAAALYYPGYDTLSASYGYHLADMVVTQTHQRKGVGRLLIAALAKQTLAEKKEWVSLTALKQNLAAQGFYQSLGMHRVNVDFFAMGKTALAQL